MSYYPHQITKGDEVVAVLKQYGVCYLAGEVRSGKTRTALYALGKLPVKRVLWLTKKQAIDGIVKEVAAVGATCVTTVTNYEQAPKLKAGDYDLVVLDEAHNLATRGKATARVKAVRALAFDKPLLLLSGTPSVETSLGLYHQFCVTRYTPLKFKNFYEFFRAWGIPNTIWLHGRAVEQYNRAKPELLDAVEPYFVRMTQADAGITAVADDVVHTFELGEDTLKLINKIVTDNVATIGGEEVVFETDMSVRVAIHQIEAGALLVEDRVIDLPCWEMVDYIRKTFGDKPDVAVMCHFRSTRQKIQSWLPNVHVYSSDGHAEGVDLSHYRAFVIANSGYSGAKFIQRRDRGTRIDVKTPRKVHHLMVKGALSERVYSAVSVKKDYNLAQFRRDMRA